MNEELDVAKRQKDESDNKFVAHIWMRSSVLQCVAARCSVLQCVAVCCVTHMNKELDVSRWQKDESDSKFVAHI